MFLKEISRRFVARFMGLYDRFDYVVVVMLAVILLLPKFQLIPVEGTYVNIRTEDFLIGCLYALWFVGVVAGRFSINAIFQARSIILFLIYGFFITALGIYIFGTVKEPTLGLLHWLRRVEYVGFYFVAATALREQRVVKYAHALLVVGVLAWIYGFLQYFDLVPGVHTLSKSGTVGTYSELGYLISTFAAHYDFGAFLILMTLLSVWGYYIYPTLRMRLMFVVMAFAFWWMSRLVYGRAAYLGMLVALVIVFAVKLSGWILVPLIEIVRTFDRYLGGQFSRYTYDIDFGWSRPTPVIPTINPTVIPTPAIVPGVSITPIPLPTETVEIPVGAVPPVTPPLVERWLDQNVNLLSHKLTTIFGTLNIKLDPSANMRLGVWQDAIAKVGYHYWWGGGYYTAGLGTDNDYVRLLVEVGVIGLAWFILILRDFMRACWQLYRRIEDRGLSHYYLVTMAFIIGLMIEAIFIDIFESSKIAFLFWFMMATVSITQTKSVASKI